MLKLRPIFLVIAVLLVAGTSVQGNWVASAHQNVESIPDNPDGRKFAQIREQAIAENLSKKPFPEIISIIAQKFVGASYQAGLLDKSSQETLFASLTKFDCVLFVETVLALVKGIAIQDYSYTTFTQNLVEQRYRHGKIGGYCDRLHYFSEWIADNEQRGKVINLTQSLGGIPLKTNLNFMTSHRGSYRQIAKDEAVYQCIAQVEQSLRNLKLTYLPTPAIKSIYPQLKSGDIVAITTKIKGLDVTHTGLVYRQGNQVGLVHASPAGKVTIAPDLQYYTSQVPQAIGIFVVRPVAP